VGSLYAARISTVGESACAEGVDRMCREHSSIRWGRDVMKGRDFERNRRR
jgi:hypothetical protein